MELVKQHQQDLRTATQFRHGAWRVLTPSSRSSGRCRLLDTCSLLQPAQFFVRKRSSEKLEVVTVGVLEANCYVAATTLPATVAVVGNAQAVRSWSRSRWPPRAAAVPDHKPEEPRLPCSRGQQGLPQVDLEVALQAGHSLAAVHVDRRYSFL